MVAVDEELILWKVHRKKDRRALGCNVADLDAAWSDAHYSSFLSRIDVGSSDEKSAAGDTSTSDSDSSDGVNHSRGLRRRRRGDLERLIREEKNGPAERSNRADDESRSKKRRRQEKVSKKKVKEKKNKSHKKPKK